jgi:EAL domain-containing protein (putative c-di-GMP-specific phosphodiesterase class I)
MTENEDDKQKRRKEFLEYFVELAEELGMKKVAEKIIKDDKRDKFCISVIKENKRGNVDG